MMDILCTTFGYFLKHKKSNQDFMVQMQALHSFILFLKVVFIIMAKLWLKVLHALDQS
jgi:hypothetical protein